MKGQEGQGSPTLSTTAHNKTPSLDSTSLHVTETKASHSPTRAAHSEGWCLLFSASCSAVVSLKGGARKKEDRNATHPINLVTL